MKEIKLTQGQVALVDDEDFEYINQWKWSALKRADSFYAVRAYRTNYKSTTVFMHRVIMRTPNDLVVDHINHIGFDNRKMNLRNCTQAQNLHNMRAVKEGTSLYKGVCFIKNNRWAARIRVNYKRLYLGEFKTQNEAALAYNAAAIKHHGEFACVNIIIDL
jgi:hypothetical protein